MHPSHSLLRGAAAVVAALSAVPAQQGAVVPIGTKRFVDAQALVATATGSTFNGMLGVGVDNAGHYYVTARRNTPTNPHLMFEFDAAGAYVTTYVQPAATQSSAWGIRDLAHDATTNVLYGGLEGSTIYAFDASTGTWDPTKDVVVSGSTIGTVRALALDAASGTFFTCSFGSDVERIDRATGAANPVTFQSVSSGVYGAGIRTEGGAPVALMLHSQSPSWAGPSALGKTLSMVEIDLTTGLETGNYFYGDHILPGVAGGAEVATIGGAQVLVSLSQGTSADGFYAQRVEDRYGTGCGPSLDYSGGNPYAGNNGFTLVATALAGSTSFLLISWGDMQTPLGGLASCPLLVNFPVFTATPSGVLNNKSSWNLVIPSPMSEGVAYFQVVDFGGVLPVKLSNGLRLGILP